MTHDALFKELVQRWIGALLSLFLPGIAAEVGLDHLEWLTGEVVTDPVDGTRRIADLVGKLERRRDGAPVLLHIEVQRQRKRESSIEADALDQRMFWYNALLHLRHRTPVSSVAFVSYRLSQAISEREWSLPGITGPSTTHRYWAISLPRVDAEALVASGSLIGAGFGPACRLPRSRVARVALYKQIHARLVQAENGREAETRDIALLARLLEAYLPLRENERVEWNRELEGMTMARVAQKNWFESALEEAEERAAERAATSEAQRALRVVIEQRLGTIPADLDSAIAALDLEHARRALSLAAAAHTAADIRAALNA